MKTRLRNASLEETRQEDETKQEKTKQGNVKDLIEWLDDLGWQYEIEIRGEVVHNWEAYHTQVDPTYTH